MGTEGERYEFIREKIGLSKKDFAESLGLSMSMGSQIASGIVRPSRNLLDRLTATYNVNLHWFLTGKGPSGLDPDTVEIELLDQKAAAGLGREVEDYAGRRTFQVPQSFIAPYRPEKLQAVSVAGDSMTGDNIHSGDIVIFYPELQEGEGIYVVSVENSLFVKKVSHDPYKQTIDLVSSNGDYPVRHYEGPELADIRIAGKVIAVFHRL
jgi:phage repressor protein C with HTH and peptisase S24 domain